MDKNSQKTRNGQIFTRGNDGNVKVTQNGQAIKHITNTRADLALNQGKKV